MDYLEEKNIEIDSELECPICNDLYTKPVSINCGHTFCRECLEQSLKIKPVCPLCRSPTFLHIENVKENIAIKPYGKGKFELDVKIIDRIEIEKIDFFENENEDIQRQYDLQEKIPIFISNGKTIQDDPLELNDFSEESGNKKQLTDIIMPILEFYKRQLLDLRNISPNTYVRILYKLGNIDPNFFNFNQIISSLSILSKFSFIVAGSLRSRFQEKEKMFLTTNIIERLFITYTVLSRMEELKISDPLQIFEIDSPAQTLMSLKNSFLLILVIGILMYFLKINNPKYY